MTDRDLELSKLDKLTQLEGADIMTADLNNEQHDEMEAFKTVNLIITNASYSITLRRIKPDKFRNEAIETPNKSVKANEIDATEENIGSTDHNIVIERGKSDNKNDSEAPESGTIDSEVINTHTDYGLKNDKSTAL